MGIGTSHARSIQDILPVSPIYMIDEMDHAVVSELISDRAHVDVVIPRGGKGLIQYVVQKRKKYPSLKTGAGFCVICMWIKKPISIWPYRLHKNAKLQRPSVCNAIENHLGAY
jgi:glutamate-5-semialdehyde dehydrogenase